MALKYIYIVILLSVFSTSLSFAQERCSIKGDVTVKGGTLDDVRITLYKDAEKVSVNGLTKGGKFSYDLEFGYDFILEFSKKDFVTKRISVSTYVPQDVLERDSKFPPCKISIELFKVYPGVDLSLFDAPIGIVMYNSETDLIETDLSHYTEIENELRRIERETKLKEKNLEAEYNLAIKRGDSEFSRKGYDLSKSYYNEALVLKPDEFYPKEQLAKIELLVQRQDDKLEAQRLIDEKYNAFIELADKNFDGANYEQAKLAYNDAISVKPGEKYPKNQLSRIEKIEFDIKLKAENELAASIRQKQNEIDEKYKALISLGDKQLDANEYISAKESYTEAWELKSNETYPKNQLLKIEGLLAKEARLAEENENQERKCAELIALADSEMSAEDYDRALYNYTLALKIKPDLAYLNDQVEKAKQGIIDKNRRLEEEAKQEFERKQRLEKYAGLILNGDNSLAAKKYEESFKHYEDALEIFPEEKYPKEQLEKLKELIAEVEQIKTDERLLREKYLALVDKGDSEFKVEEFEAAITHYQLALEIKPEESYLKNQIKLAGLKLKELERLARLKLSEEENNRLIEEKYQSAILVADAALENDNLNDASANYRKALDYKPADPYATSQFEKVRLLIVDFEEQQAEEAKRLLKEKALLNKQFLAFVKEGDQLFKNKDFAGAIAEYESAIKIVADDAYVLKQIDLAYDELIKLKQDSEKQLAIKKEYDELISSADKLFAENEFVSAKEKYQKAIDLEYKSAYPKEQIRLIDLAIIKQEQDDNKNRKLELEFEEALAAADSQFEKKSYSVARFHYKEAEVLKPENAYVKSQLREIEMILKNKDSKEDQSLAQGRSAFDDNLLKKKEAEYEALIKEGDAAMKGQYLGKAKAYYLKALALFERDYPREKLREIDGIRLRFKSEKDRLAYEKFMNSGDEEFQKGNYSASRFYYQKASPLTSDRSVIEEKLEKIEKALNAAKYKAIDIEFNALVEKGNVALKSGRLSVAKFYFLKALDLKPNDEQVKKSLDNINKSEE